MRLTGRGPRLGGAPPGRRVRRRRGPSRLLRPEGGAPVNYAMLIYGDDAAWVDLSYDERMRLREQQMPQWISLFDELRKADSNVVGQELDGRSSAKVVRVRDGE